VSSEDARALHDSRAGDFPRDFRGLVLRECRHVHRQVDTVREE